jgi:RNA polymerase sigma-70 factor (ECF subfamily)
MAALEVIYDKLGRRIFTLSLSILRDIHSAEDIMQDTFIKISAEAVSYRPGSNASAWILTVARNLSINCLNRRNREVTCDELIDSPQRESEETPLGALEALSLLDDEERQIVTLKLDGGMKHKAIAELLGITPAACEKKYRRALEKLKKYYI